MKVLTEFVLAPIVQCYSDCLFSFFFLGVFESCDVSPSHVIPLKKQQGFLNLLGQMFMAVGQNMEHYLDTLFPILLNLATICTSLLDQRNEVQFG